MNFTIKRIIPLGLVILSFVTFANDSANHVVTPSAKSILMERLNGFEQLSATFSQQVIDEEKNVLQEATGKLALKKPDLVYWENKEPEETLIVSDGETLWFFDPFIEQATAYSVDASIASTPILLLSSSDEKLWSQFSITQSNQNNFLIHAIDENSRIKTLELNFIDNSSQIQSFSLLDSTGQFSIFKLDNVDIASTLSPTLFQFVLPSGIELDDQR